MAKKLRPDMSVRLVAYDYPDTRQVFLQYGEEDDRQVFGHLETLEHFARRRGVDRDRLLQELSEATGLEVDRHAVRDENLHRPFILTALLVTLTLGAGWGAHLLTRIGMAGSFEGASPAFVIAHGTAQLWGFLAIFIVGIALRYFSLTTSKPAPTIPVRSFVLGAFILGVLTEFAWSLAPQALTLLGPMSGVAFVFGAGTYLFLVMRFLWERLGQVWARFVTAASMWLFAWACWTLYLQSRVASFGPASFSMIDRQIIMDLALFGLALGSIYGFGRKLLPGFLATGTPRTSFFEGAFWLHNGGLTALMIGHLLKKPALVAGGLCCIGAGALMYVGALRGLRGRPVSSKLEQGHPFLRAYIQLAFGWLVASLAGFVIVALCVQIGGVDVPHAVIGALRHALTVGFLTTLILGVGQRLLPILGHTLLAYPRLVVPIFLFIGTGNFLRVVSEVATPWWPLAFTIMPFSALLELTALLLFTANAIRTMWPAVDPLIRTGQVTRDSRAAILLTAKPWIEDILIDWGMNYLGRVRQIPTELTMGTLIYRDGLDPPSMIDRINELLRRHQVDGTRD